MNGSQSQLDFLPESSTDFIFAVVGEEFGFIGTVRAAGLYGFIVAARSVSPCRPRTPSRGCSAGASRWLLHLRVHQQRHGQGIVPVVGVPLPLISYGGTSMVTLLAGFGILMSIHSHRKLVGSY